MLHVLAAGRAAGATRRWVLRPLGDDGVAAPDREVDAADLAALDRADPGARWVVDSVAGLYPAVLAAGARLSRCHDVRAVERILLGREALHGRPSSARAVLARRAGLPEPADPPEGDDVQAAADRPEQALFETAPPVPAVSVGEVAGALADQQQRLGDDGALRLLAAAESASWLAAVEMSATGLPFDAEVHRAHLGRLLGPRPLPGARPAVLADLASRLAAALGTAVNPDSPADLRAAFARLGHAVATTRSRELQGIDHPAAALAVEYRELARLWTANGWTWLDEWVRDGRFRTEYLPGGVVSGRWATRGGGALQIPRSVRGAVRAEPGHRLVVADAAQLEPRVLAAISGDPALQLLAADADLYAGIAADGFGGDRAHAKTAMLGALYGATTGESGRLLPALRRRYPQALAYVEAAADRGERGLPVRSVLGRASPRPGGDWRDAVALGASADADPAQERRGRSAARAWGRFTRNFVVQASAADWAAVWLSTVRTALAGLPGVELVFFQHDEVVLHAPIAAAGDAAAVTERAAATAYGLVFPGAQGSTPVQAHVVDCYADAK
ncbi:bifunctional 3'-5' exonuclease/DNA polymerase [Nakamurella endophytica]|uniref:DNA-directed DNA polymerase n=1 Tax=Nakamurella endophytica TaxID=1748367 RepID=A0A917WDR0_9ACTN|nr:bifunctional 3'-5' exonuclease/DNA polymerase [Nakamurella endophytica]GGL95991.1 DNA polymerase I [Nakamurella endophytica]